MTFFKINNMDFSQFVSGLQVQNKAIYSQNRNIAGNTVVDYIGTKNQIKVDFIPMSDADMYNLLAKCSFECQVSFLNPKTRQLATITCICPQTAVSYYTIQSGNVMLKKCSITFQQL